MSLLAFPGMVIRTVDLLVAAEAARMRAESSLRLPDALVLATGVMSSVDCLVTNDRRMAAATAALIPEMRICLLSDYV
jgi:hypothetical protein